MSKKTYSRLEINRMVRRILQQCNVDMQVINFSSSVRNIRIYGKLAKNTGRDLEVKEVENMMRVLEGIPGISDISFDLENWNITAGSISAKGGKKKKKSMEQKKKPSSDGASA